MRLLVMCSIPRSNHRWSHPCISARCLINRKLEPCCVWGLWWHSCLGEVVTYSWPPTWRWSDVFLRFDGPFASIEGMTSEPWPTVCWSSFVGSIDYSFVNSSDTTEIESVGECPMDFAFASRQWTPVVEHREQFGYVRRNPLDYYSHRSFESHF